MNPYETAANDFARILARTKKLPLGGFSPLRHPALPPDAPTALIFSPHPDDECIIGALPLRLRREARLNVINVAVTLGSKKSRRAARKKELQAACASLGFGLEFAAPVGLERITLESRKGNRRLWERAVQQVARILAEHNPRFIFVPHADDGHPTHIGTHFLVTDALKKMPKNFACVVVETEFWRAMATPNLLIESSAGDMAALMAALSCHRGEVERNPYHALLSAWMMDNVRRGAELVGGPGAKAPEFTFATLYRFSWWGAGRLSEGRCREAISSGGAAMKRWTEMNSITRHSPAASRKSPASVR